jgi:hypothetical protein
MLYFKDREALNLDAVVRVLPELKALRRGHDEVPNLLVVNLQERDLNLESIVPVFATSIERPYTVKDLIYRVVHQTWLVLVADHSVRLASPCHAVGEDGGVVAAQHHLRQLLRCSFVDLPIRAVVVEDHIKAVIPLKRRVMPRRVLPFLIL